MARKKKEVYIFDCQRDNCEAKFESYDDLEAHSQYTHASVYDKAYRGDYTNKLPLNELFQRDLEVEEGVETNPKKNKLFELAWSHGHSSGFYEIVNYYHEFAELIR